MTGRQGQAIVEVLALAPLLVALLLAFVLALERLTALADAERALGAAVRALAAGESPPAPAERIEVQRLRGVVVVRVDLRGPDLVLRAPWGGP